MDIGKHNATNEKELELLGCQRCIITRLSDPGGRRNCFRVDVGRINGVEVKKRSLAKENSWWKSILQVKISRPIVRNAS